MQSENILPDIAVIMSLYKKDKLMFVRESVESILNQDFEDFHFYIVYDGPIKAEVDNFISQINDSRIYIIKRDENKGLAYSLNQLLKKTLMSSYAYIARMDADDISMPYRLSTQLQYFNNHPDVECLGSWAIEIKSDGTEYYRKQMPETHKDCLTFFKKRDCMIHPTVMFKRSFIEKAGLYPEDTYFGEDTMMWAKGFAASCTFANVQEYLLKFRLDDNFFERRRGWKHASSIFKLRHRVNKLLGFGLKEDIYALLYAVAKMMPTPILNLIYKTAR